MNKAYTVPFQIESVNYNALITESRGYLLNTKQESTKPVSWLNVAKDTRDLVSMGDAWAKTEQEKKTCLNYKASPEDEQKQGREGTISFQVIQSRLILRHLGNR